MKAFGEIIKEKRKARRWSRSKLAKKLNTHMNTVIGWECYNRLPNIYTCIDLADLFECALDELCGREVTKNEN